MRTIGFYGLAGLELVDRTIAGVLRYCEEGGFMVRDFRMREAALIRPSVPPPWHGGADGIVLTTTRPAESSDKQIADWVLAGGVPAVSVGADFLDPRIPNFHAGMGSVAQLAADHLTQCGCASFIYFGLQASTGSGQRGEALRDALAERGQKLVEFATTYRYIGIFENETQARSETKLAALLQKMRKPIGVLALNDNFACAVCVLCESLGLAIPEQVKVLGLGDLTVARTHRPALSSIRTPNEEAGYLAMQALHQRLDGKRSVPRETEVPATELVARASTVGALPANGNLKEAIKYIERHACNHLTVDHVAAAMGTPRRSLERRFQELLGHTPGEEIQRVRLEKAKELLEKTQFSISRIALMVGFEETAPFTRFFTKQTGISPSKYRVSNAS
ncbi:MAG: substrate-binding domain-containing protein [Planctomycetes bacterium]|nr:substrate-binding domain-containing protein [Planctomycetota bacterium]